MKLVESGPRRGHRPRGLRPMKSFLGETLGKGVVEAKDTPNFIANRIGTFGMMLVLKVDPGDASDASSRSMPSPGRSWVGPSRRPSAPRIWWVSMCWPPCARRLRAVPDDEQRDIYRDSPGARRPCSRTSGWARRPRAVSTRRKTKRSSPSICETLEYPPRPSRAWTASVWRDATPISASGCTPWSTTPTPPASSPGR